MGRAYLTGRTTAEWLYFAKATKQRAANFNQDVQLTLPTSYATPRFGVSYGTTRQRLNDEIDARARRKAKAVQIGSDVRVSPRTSLDGEWRYTTFEIAEDQFLGVNLADALNRQTTTAQLSLKYAATPLTTLVFRGASAWDRFERNALRDSDSVSAMAGFDLKPLALISGSALVGVRHFNLLDDRLPDFTGVISAVGVTYNARETTKVNAKVSRDVDYSFLAETPYFVSTGVTLGVIQGVGGNWDVVVNGTRTMLAYRVFDTTDVPPSTTTWGYHVSLGYHFSFNARLGFDVDYTRRDSSFFGRNYDGFRAGGSFAYGL
jgi:hypothetical protein